MMTAALIVRLPAKAAGPAAGSPCIACELSQKKRRLEGLAMYRMSSCRSSSLTALVSPGISFAMAMETTGVVATGWLAAREAKLPKSSTIMSAHGGERMSMRIGGTPRWWALGGRK